MNCYKKKKILLILLLMAFLFSPSVSFAIGHWQNGTVTVKPSNNKLASIEINTVKYTIMADCPIQLVTITDQSTNKESTLASSIQTNDAILFKSSGNRIYAIEILVQR